MAQEATSPTVTSLVPFHVIPKRLLTDPVAAANPGRFVQVTPAVDVAHLPLAPTAQKLVPVQVIEKKLSDPATASNDG